MTKWATAALLAAFAALCLCRLNGFSLLEPDTPEYFFGAKSLASFHGYREIDRPDQPLHTFRPPGLPFLLVPLTWVAPYSVLGGKLIVIVFAVAALYLTVRLASRDGPAAWPIVVGLIVASSPYALLHATEVVTEFPYLACSLAAIVALTKSVEPPSRRQIWMVAVLLTFLPFLRTIGLALVIAVLIWCLSSRRRRAFWPAPIAALAGTALWMWRNALAGGPTYFGAIENDLKNLGTSGFAARSFETLRFYAGRFVDVLLPGVRPGRPLYERLTIGGAPDLHGLFGIGLALGIVIIALAVYGAWTRRKDDGALVALYAAGFAAMLAIYPPKHERLTWPLVPVAVVMAVAGLAQLRRPVRLAGAAVAFALIAWQSAASAAIARDNLAWAGGGDRFYAERVPPIYFADWRAAGSWLRKNAPPGARVLTRHSDVGFTSRLPQDGIRFEELPPAAWRARIAKLHARYLVVPTTLFGKFFPLELLGSDPVYSYAIRWRGKDAAVVEVSPNRGGRVAPPASASPEDAAACDRALSAEPRRVDLATRCAELLAASGRPDDAAARLRALVAKGDADVRVQVALGQLLASRGDDAGAALAFRAAEALPEADLLAQTIAGGRAASERRLAGAATDLPARARAEMDGLRWDDARRDLDPENPAALEALGELQTRLGAYDEAIAAFRAAAAAGNARAAARADALADALAVETSLETAEAGAIVRAASYWAGDGAPGRALDILERAAARLPGEPSIAERLAEVRRFYGLD